jgi:uncharacterized damage-inducible protein DinB
METKRRLVAENISYLQQARELISKIDVDLFTTPSKGIYSSSAGQHFRHILDHYSSFLSCNGNTIDYDDRQRDSRLELEPDYTIQKIDELQEAFHRLGAESNMSDVSLQIICNSENESVITYSTIERELQFLISHTVHHFAIIAMILDDSGFNLPETFGVAPSTLRHLQDQDFNADTSA